MRPGLSIALLIAVSCLQLLLLRSASAQQAPDDDVTLGPGKIGLIVETLTPQRAKEVGDPLLRGAEVKAVTRGSPAERQGVAPGDIIVRMNGTPVVKHSEVAALLRDRWVGGSTRLQIRRGPGQPLVEIVVPAASQPILRIDAGMHNAPIRKLSIDRAGKWLVTVSEDKTAKVWDLASGKLARSLRPPVGDDAEGKLAAVAVSPDGASVAIAGWTGLWGKGASAYVFDRATGRLARRLQGPPGVVEALAWSPDGGLLAVSFAGSSGVRVYRTSGWESIDIDQSSTAHVAVLDFDRTGRLLTAGQDGALCIYAPGPDGFRLAVKRVASDAQPANAARFSPDGASIAVTYAGSTRVDVFAANELKVAYAADTQSIKNGDLRTVAWSADGRVLYAAGRYVEGKRQAIRSWPDAGRGHPIDRPVAANSIFDMQALADGTLAFCTAEPGWGVITAEGRTRYAIRSQSADLRGDGEQLRVSGDGHRIQFRLDKSAGLAAAFDIDNGLTVVRTAEASTTTTAAPATAGPGLTITGWKDTDQPKLNGIPLRMQSGENSRSLALAPDGRSFVIGGDRAISKFDANGKLLGRITTPGAAWAVNVSGDGRFIVGGFADGTIRWYGANDGREKLALFSQSDGQRWVAWSPSGYYTASAAGEELIGWQVNRGPEDAGDFYPASRFRARLYRPDVLARVLDSDTDVDAYRLANQTNGSARAPVQIANALPPVIDPVSATENQFQTTRVAIRFRVRGADDAPLQGLRVRVNGGNVPQPPLPLAPQEGAQGEHLVEVSLPMRDSTVELFAENRNGVSTPAVFKFVWRGVAPAKPLLPTLYVLAIGVSTYRDHSISLGYPAKDAKDFVETLRSQHHQLYGDIQIVLLTDELATRKAVLEGLAKISSQVKADDVGVVFIAGHGFNADDGTYYYLPFDFDRTALESTGSAASGVVYSAIRETLAGMAGRAMLFIDTCHSGNVLGRSDLTSVINDLTARENNVVVFASSTSKELSQESDAWKNGAFTKALVAGLRGEADLLKDGKVMYTGLQYYLSRTVSTMTRGAQHPVVIAPGGVEDFVVAIP